MRRLLAVLVLATLGCGVMTAPSPTVTPTLLATNVLATETATPLLTVTTKAEVLATRTPVLLAIDGCWNLRTGPSANAQIATVQCGGSVEFDGWAANGFANVGGLYICGRAFGEEVKCR